MGIVITDDAVRIAYYEFIHFSNGGRHEPRWRGVQVVKFPQDLILYAQVIQKRRPDFIIETGTRFGGSALFFADMLQLIGGKKCISIDITNPPPDIPDHPNLMFLRGSSIDPDIVEQVKSIVGTGSVMTSFDSDHSQRHVARELALYAPIVTPGQYMVVEDCWTRHEHPYKPYFAIRGFLAGHPEFSRVNVDKQFVFAVTRDGWLIKAV